MLINHCIGIILAFSSGLLVSAGTFAFFLVMRVLPRMTQKAKLSHQIISIENAVIKGTLFGTLISVFSWENQLLFSLLGSMLLTVYGLAAGVFAGCLAVALAEILNIFPIFFRRAKLNPDYSRQFLFIMAAGKLIGSLFYFYKGYGIFE